MVRAVLLALLCVVCAPVYATGSDHSDSCHGNCRQETEGGAPSTSEAVSESVSSAESGSVSAAAGGDAAATGGDASATAGDSSADSNSGGNSFSVTEKHQRPAASTPAAVIGNTTAECRAFIGLSGMGTNGGGGLGFPLRDKDCVHMTLAAAAFAAGNNEAGWTLYCSAPTVRKVVGEERCMATAPVASPIVVTANVIDKVVLPASLSRSGPGWVLAAWLT